MSGLDEEPIPMSGSDEDEPQPSAQAAPSSSPVPVLHEVCKRAAAHPSVLWPVQLYPVDQEINVHDGKLLGPPAGPKKQLFPVLP